MKNLKFLAALLLLLPFSQSAKADLCVDSTTGKYVTCPITDSAAAGVGLPSTTTTGLGSPTFVTTTNSFNGGTHGGLLLSDTTGPALNIKRSTTGATDTVDMQVTRAANYTGGNSSFVNSAFSATTTTTAGANNYEWAGLFRLNNSNTAANASQNVAFAAKAYKLSTGITFGENISCIDSLADPTTGCTASEIDDYVNGTDANGVRLIMHLVYGNNSFGPTTGHINDAILIGPETGTTTGIIDNAGIEMNGDYKYGMLFTGAPTTAGSMLISDQRTGANMTYGLNLGGSYTSGAIYLRDNKNIIWSSDQTSKTKYVSADSCLETLTTTTAIWKVCDDGHVAATGGLTVTGAITPSTTAGIVGTAAADSPTAGSVGQVVSLHCVVGTAAAAASAVTITIAVPGVVTWTGGLPITSSTGLANYTCPINFTGTPPTGIVVGTNYFIVGSSVSGNSFSISDTAAHALAGTNKITTTGSDGGTTAYIGNLGATTTTFSGAGISLVAGDWDCNALAEYQELTSITASRWVSAINTAAATIGAIGTFTDNRVVSGIIGAANEYTPSPVVQENISSTTSVFAVVNSTFTAGTMNEGGLIRCRRMR